MKNKNKVFIVAEVGNNHEGNYLIAKKLILEAKKCGADAVKFQTFIPESFVSIKDLKKISQLKKFQLSFNEFKSLSSYSKKIGIKFFSTPFDIQSARFLKKIQSVFKISSSDNDFYPLLNEVASFNKHIFLSTGLADLNDISKSKKIIFKNWKKKRIKNKKLILLHCVTSYPVKPEEANLKAITTLKQKFKDCTIGYSDHTIGITACISAVALGARVVEKHFTLNKNYSSFRDHKISADPAEMRDMISKIRDLEFMLGNGIKNLQKSEKLIVNILRRKAVANVSIKKGSKIKTNNLKWVRANHGFSIQENYKILKAKAKRHIQKNEIIQKKHLKN